jgi:HK97 family phage major capsid protein
MQDYITSTFSNSPAIDSITQRPLIASGMSFTIPRQTAAPTVAITAEGAAPSETGVTSDYLTVDVKKFAGLQRMTFEIIDRSDPNYFAEVLTELQKAYTKACDNAVIAAFTASGTQAAVVATTAAGLQSFVATETAAAYKGSAEFAENLVVSPDQWAAIMGYADTTGRPLYIAGQPANAAGVAAPTSARGSVLGLNLFVDQNIATSGLVDESAFIVAPGAATWYSSGTTQLQVNKLTDGKVEVELYGYGAVAIRKPLGIRRYNVA